MNFTDRLYWQCQLASSVNLFGSRAEIVLTVSRISQTGCRSCWVWFFFISSVDAFQLVHRSELVMAWTRSWANVVCITILPLSFLNRNSPESRIQIVLMLNELQSIDSWRLNWSCRLEVFHVSIFTQNFNYLWGRQNVFAEKLRGQSTNQNSSIVTTSTSL